MPREKIKLIIPTFIIRHFSRSNNLICKSARILILVIHHLAPLKIFMCLIFKRELALDRENSDYFMWWGKLALSHYGGCHSGGGEASNNVSMLENRWNFLNFSALLKSHFLGIRFHLSAVLRVPPSLPQRGGGSPRDTPLDSPVFQRVSTEPIFPIILLIPSSFN